MNVLSLFTGAGGGELAFQHLLDGFTTIGYVEIDDYCQRVLAQRIKDGLLDNAPIFTDIKAFIDSGCCELYKGITNVITGGFPCQDISCAGKGAGIEGERSGLWSEMAEVVRQIRPKYIFVENSPMLTIRGLETVLRDLAQMGYNAKWGCISAENSGALRKRERIWILAYSKYGCSSMFNESLERTQRKIQKRGKQFQSRAKIRNGHWRLSEPTVDRVVNGMASILDKHQNTAIANGQVPIVAATAWEILKP